MQLTAVLIGTLLLPLSANAQLHTDEAVTDSLTFEAEAPHVSIWLRLTSNQQVPVATVVGGGTEWTVEQDVSASPRRRLVVYRSSGPVAGSVEVRWGVRANAALIVLEHESILQSTGDNWSDGRGTEGRQWGIKLPLSTPRGGEYIAGVVVGHRSARITESSCTLIARAGLGLPMFVYSCPTSTADWTWRTNGGAPHWMAAGIEVGASRF